MVMLVLRLPYLLTDKNSFISKEKKKKRQNPRFILFEKAGDRFRKGSPWRRLVGSRSDLLRFAFQSWPGSWISPWKRSTSSEWRIPIP